MDTRKLALGVLGLTGAITGIYYILKEPTEDPNEGDTKCIGYNLFQYTNSNWMLLETNSATCGYISPTDFICHECGKIFLTETELLLHMEQMHPITMPSITSAIIDRAVFSAGEVVTYLDVDIYNPGDSIAGQEPDFADLQVWITKASDPDNFDGFGMFFFRRFSYSISAGSKIYEPWCRGNIAYLGLTKGMPIMINVKLQIFGWEGNPYVQEQFLSVLDW